MVKSGAGKKLLQCIDYVLVHQLAHLNEKISFGEIHTHILQTLWRIQIYFNNGFHPEPYLET
jgi:hypothetical protein